MPGTRKWRGVYAEENAFRYLSGCEMATLAAYDRGHGQHSWSRMEEHPSIHNCHGPAVNFFSESGCEP